MANLAKNTNPDTLKMLQLVLEAAHIDASNPAASSPRSPADADVPPVDVDMGNAAEAASPNKVANGCTEVDLDSSDDHENGDAF